MENKAKSCGCLKGNLKHGMSGTKTYASWAQMKTRCLNINASGYKYYGSRGIKVCKRWLKFENFYADMGDKPTPSHSIERRNNNGDYEPGNCKWATISEQNNNKRNNVILTYKGASMNLSQWAEKLGISRACLWDRVNRNLPKSAIFTSEKNIKQKYKTKYTEKYGMTLKEITLKFNITVHRINKMNHKDIEVLCQSDN